MIGTLLASAGISIFKDIISDHGQDIVEKGIEKVTGIKLEGKDKLSDEEIKIIKNNQENILRYNYENLKLALQDRANARESEIKKQTSSDWLVRNTGSLLAIFTIITAFVLDVILIYMVVNGTTVNPIYTLIQGAMNVRAVQVLSFYFGESKTNADSKRN